MEKLLLTPEETAEALGIGRTRVYALIGDGSLRSVRIGSSRRICEADVREFVERLRQEA